MSEEINVSSDLEHRFLLPTPCSQRPASVSCHTADHLNIWLEGVAIETLTIS